MDCKSAEKEIPAWIQGESPSETSTALQIHLESCSNCNKSVEDMKTILKQASSLPDYEGSKEFTSKLMGQISRELSAISKPNNNENTRKRRTRPIAKISFQTRLRYFAAAAAVVILFVGLIRLIPAQKFSNPSPANDKVAELRFIERKSTNLRWDDKLEIKKPVLSSMGFEEIDTIYLAQHIDHKTGEQCLMAYSSADVEQLRQAAVSKEQKEKLERVLTAATIVNLENGDLRLPEKMLPLLARSRDVMDVGVTVVRLAGRWEIWNTKSLENYLNNTIDVETVLPKKSGEPKG